LSSLLGSAGSRQYRMRHLLIMAVWAFLLALGGLGLGSWALFILMSGSAPGWFEPVIILMGLVGLSLAMSAFPATSRPRLPWILLGASTVVFIVGLILTVNAA